MKAHITTAIALGLALMASQANAIPEWKQTTPTFFQLSNSTFAAGLVVQAEAPRPMLGIGGGFTINCTIEFAGDQRRGQGRFVRFFWS